MKLQRLHKYNTFIGEMPLNEDLNKSKKFLKERFLLRKSAENLGLIKGELEAQLKHGEKKSLVKSDFTEEEFNEIRLKMREIKISPDEIRRIEREPEFLELREVLKDNIGYLYNFTYMYYVEMVPIDEIKTLYNKVLEYRDLLNRLPRKFDLHFIDTNIDNNSEVLVDGLDTLEDYRKVKKVVDKLTNVLKTDYNKSSDDIKEEFAQVARSLNDLGKGEDGVVDEVKRENIWKNFFGDMRLIDGQMKYVGQLRRYQTIGEFIRAAQNFLKSSENDDIMKFYDKINECNEKFGNSGVDVVLDEGGILILEVKSFQANQMMNGHTRHCIKDSNSQWESYVSNHSNKQYYIYNFNIPQYDDMSVIGITIEPGQRIKAAHKKNDGGVSGSIKATLNSWTKEYSISENLWEQLRPMSDEEIKKRELAKEAERKIVEKGISIDDIIRYVKENGANINKNNGICLKNAVSEDDYEKVKTILELGANTNLTKNSDAPISLAKNLDMIKLLISAGSEMTSDVFNNIVQDSEALEYCLKKGLDPDFKKYYAIRRVCRGTYEISENGTVEQGEAYLDSLKVLLKYNASLRTDKDKNTILKWTVEYDRPEVVKFLVEEGYAKKYFKSEDWTTAIEWARLSRSMSESKFQEFSDFLTEMQKITENQ